jgi:hypothetical protein
MTVHGTGLQLLQYIDILDSEGLAIIPNSSILVPNPGVGLDTAGKKFTLAGTALASNGGSLDSGETYSRRLKIKTPWGIVYSDADESGSFSLTADPVLPESAAATFAGGGFTGTNTYDINSTVGTWPTNLLPLIINGQNLRSVGNIAFVNDPPTVYYRFDVNALTPPSGITFSADGKQISIAGLFIWQKSNGWYNSNGEVNRGIRLTTGANQVVDTPYIETDPFANDTGVIPTQITSLGGSGWSAFDTTGDGIPYAVGHFERNGTLVITGNGLDGVTHVTLTGNNGLEIPQVDPLVVDGSDVNASTTTVTVGANLFDTDANLLDSVDAGSRRVKLFLVDGSTLGSDANETSGAFSVSKIPTFGAFGQAYAAVGGADGGASTGTYDRTVGNGNLSITSLGIDMRGVTRIRFHGLIGTATWGTVPSTTDLVPSDWTVSPDGRSITLTKNTIETKGAAWLGHPVRQLELDTAAGSTTYAPVIATAP